MTQVKNNKGMIFISALAVMLILFGLGTMYLMAARTEVRLGRSELIALRNLYIAESAVEHGIADILNGGTGEIGMGDLNGDSYTDYQTFHNPVTDPLIQGQKYASEAWPFGKTVEVTFSRYEPTDVLRFGGLADFSLSTFAPPTGGITGNICGGGNYIDFTSASGKIDGNIDADVTPNPPLAPDIDVTGSVSESICDTTNMLSITPADYAPYASFSDAGNITWDIPPAAGPGIHYISGDLTINSSGISVDSIVATGTVLINNTATGLTIGSGGKYPAIIATNIQCGGNCPANLTLNGLVYTANDLMLTSGDGVTIEGAIEVVGESNLTWQSNLTITYNPDIVTTWPVPVVTNSGPIKIFTWQGH